MHNTFLDEFIVWDSNFLFIYIVLYLYHTVFINILNDLLFFIFILVFLYALLTFLVFLFKCNFLFQS